LLSVARLRKRSRRETESEKGEESLGVDAKPDDLYVDKLKVW